jgi:hypothetical protein
MTIRRTSVRSSSAVAAALLVAGSLLLLACGSSEGDGTGSGGSGGGEPSSSQGTGASSSVEYPVFCAEFRSPESGESVGCECGPYGCLEPGTPGLAEDNCQCFTGAEVNLESLTPEDGYGLACNTGMVSAGSKCCLKPDWLVPDPVTCTCGAICEQFTQVEVESCDAAYLKATFFTSETVIYEADDLRIVGVPSCD